MVARERPLLGEHEIDFLKRTPPHAEESWFRKLWNFFDVFSDLEPATARVVRIIYLLAFLTNFLFFSSNPILLLYMKYAGFVDKVDIRFFVWVEVIMSVIPIFGNLGMGMLTSYIGARRSLCLMSFCCSFGLILIVQTSSWKTGSIYIIGTIFLTLGHSIRIVRIIFLTEIVPPRQRTTVMAVHDLWGPLGCALGPIAWILCEKFPFDLSILNVFQLNMFTLNYLLGAAVGISMGLISWFGLRDSSSYRILADIENAGKEENPQINVDGPKHVKVQLKNGNRHVVNMEEYKRNTILFFITIMFLVKISMGFLFVGFQPILVYKYQTDGKTMGIIYEAVFLASFIPTFVLAYLTRIMEDRQIILIGLLLKLAGLLLFLPVFGLVVHRWQVIAGYMMLIKASFFFLAGSISLCSKLLGPMSSGTLLGSLSSVAQIGPASAQIFFTKISLDLFGSFYYALIGLPALISLCLVIWPFFWRKLDPDREFLKVLYHEYNNHNMYRSKKNTASSEEYRGID